LMGGAPSRQGDMKIFKKVFGGGKDKEKEKKREENGGGEGEAKQIGGRGLTPASALPERHQPEIEKMLRDLCPLPTPAGQTKRFTREQEETQPAGGERKVFDKDSGRWLTESDIIAMEAMAAAAKAKDPNRGLAGPAGGVAAGTSKPVPEPQPKSKAEPEPQPLRREESGSSSVMPPPPEDPLPPGWKVCACTCARACAYANTYMRTPSPAIAVCVRTHTCHHGPGESTTTISSLRRRSGSAQNRKP